MAQKKQTNTGKNINTENHRKKTKWLYNNIHKSWKSVRFVLFVVVIVVWVLFLFRVLSSSLQQQNSSLSGAGRELNTLNRIEATLVNLFHHLLLRPVLWWALVYSVFRGLRRPCPFRLFGSYPTSISSSSWRRKRIGRTCLRVLLLLYHPNNSTRGKKMNKEFLYLKRPTFSRYRPASAFVEIRIFIFSFIFVRSFTSFFIK